MDSERNNGPSAQIAIIVPGTTARHLVGVVSGQPADCGCSLRLHWSRQHAGGYLLCLPAGRPHRAAARPRGHSLQEQQLCGSTQQQAAAPSSGSGRSAATMRLPSVLACPGGHAALQRGCLLPPALCPPMFSRILIRATKCGPWLAGQNHPSTHR